MHAALDYQNGWHESFWRSAWDNCSPSPALLAGEAILMLRLYLRDRSAPPAPRVAGSWGPALRAASSKWGLAISMVLFAWTLQDKIAEIGATVAVLVWLMLNVPRQVIPSSGR